MPTSAPLPPLSFDPIYKHRPWGGRRFEGVLGRSLGILEEVAESWELVDHGDDVSRVAAGPLAGLSLRNLLHAASARVLGRTATGAGSGSGFPILVKFLDARENLSVQVHPDDALGQRLVGDRGKTEAWVVLAADPGSLIYAGLRPAVTRAQFTTALAAGSVEPLLHRFPARVGDCVFVPAGTVHALGAGVMVAEVQQSSDATFRIDDWGRRGPDGAPRRLHTEEALAAIDFAAGPVNPVRPVAFSVAGGLGERLVRCPHFAIDRLNLVGAARVGQLDRFTVLVGLAGSARVITDAGEVSIGVGRTVLLPAEGGAALIVPDGTVRVLSCSVA